MPPPARHKELNPEQITFLDKYILRASKKVLASVLDVEFNVIKSYYKLKKRNGELNEKRGRYLNAAILNEILRTGKESSMLRKFFVKRKSQPWSPQEDSFLEDMAGVKPPHEIGLLIGRTEYSVVQRMHRLEIDPVECSGYWTIKDIVDSTGININRIYKHLYKGRLHRISNTGKNVKSVVLAVSKLRYKLRPNTKGRVIPAKKARSKVRKKPFSRVLFKEEEVNRLLETHHPNLDLDCIYCTTPTSGSLYCNKCYIEPETEEEPTFFQFVVGKLTPRSAPSWSEP